MNVSVLTDQQELIYIGSVMIEMVGERMSRTFVLSVWLDDEFFNYVQTNN